MGLRQLLKSLMKSGGICNLCLRWRSFVEWRSRGNNGIFGDAAFAGIPLDLEQSIIWELNGDLEDILPNMLPPHAVGS